MARKSARSATPAFWADVDSGSPGVPRPRPLPASVQSLFLPHFLREAASFIRGGAYEGRLEQAREVVRQWVDRLRKGHLHGLTETQVEGDLTSQFFGALGYQTLAQARPDQPWTMQPKWPFAGAGIADAALGHFRYDDGGHARGEALVVVELKGARVDLDRKDPGSGRSPVQQAWDYLTASDVARWALVTNFVEFRLYHRDKGRTHVHRAALDDLDEPDHFAEFFAVFHADSLLSETSLGLNAARLLKLTDERQAKVGEELYALYNERRYELIQHLRREAGVADLDAAIAAAQKLLDRVLFVAFAEDRDLLGEGQRLEKTHALLVPTLSAWDNFQLLFRALDEGHWRTGIPKFDGSLFRPDPILDDPAFELDDSWPEVFRSIGQFDFRHEVSVEVLGRIFERSITDLERLREGGPDAFAAEVAARKTPGRRKREGVYYTDRPIVEHLIAAALDPAWEARRAGVAARLGIDPDAPPTAEAARALLDALDALTVCDPACGSGAFLIAAYDWFEDRRMGLLDDLMHAEPDAPEADGGRDDRLARSARQILSHNLHGVDLAHESIEIARLSLWIRTARRGQTLTDLTHNVVQGNSLIDDPALCPTPFDWRREFPRVFDRGGFDAVVGNPPYVRQERLAAIKPYLQAHYRAYHGMADLYVYFYERGLDLLRPGGRLAFVVTNKWFKAGYGEPLRRLLAAESWVESVVDFGHAKQFFKDADVFPCFLVARKPDAGPRPRSARVSVVPRDLVRLDELRTLVATRSTEVELDRFGADAWSLEPAAVVDLMAKIKGRGIPLAEFAGARPFYGVKTGFNEAFLIDTETRDRLVAGDRKAADLIRPYLRGQDIERWVPDWAGLWMIFTRRGLDIDAYPTIKKHLEAYRAQLEPRPQDWQGDDWPGRKPGTYKWFETQDPIDYWRLLEGPKIIYQDITWRPSFCFEDSGMFVNNTVYFFANSDKWLLAMLNSPAGWWYAWRCAQHGKDEALRYFNTFVEEFPIPTPSDEQRRECESAVSRLIAIARSNRETRRELLDWLRVEHGVAGPSSRLREPLGLTSDEFVAEVKRGRAKDEGLSAAAVKSLRVEYEATVAPARELLAEAASLERRLHDLSNAAYGLTPEDVRLMWDTAPPRMPIPRPEP